LCAVPPVGAGGLPVLGPPPEKAVM
jgi:hypothetical protein